MGSGSGFFCYDALSRGDRWREAMRRTLSLCATFWYGGQKGSVAIMTLYLKRTALSDAHDALADLGVENVRCAWDDFGQLRGDLLCGAARYAGVPSLYGLHLRLAPGHFIVPNLWTRTRSLNLAHPLDLQQIRFPRSRLVGRLIAAKSRHPLTSKLQPKGSWLQASRLASLRLAHRQNIAKSERA